jgi:hypothetical protein
LRAKAVRLPLSYENDGSFWPNSFSLKEAVVRLRSLERDPAI